ncbi:hypothetical protein FXO37_22455 [Capsicum annuum]|nr:hypothetical protein FXO37_22455 [Capsicum annuum]
MPRGDGPFQVLERISDNAYKIDLPPEYQVHNTFNVYDLSLINTIDDDEAVNLRSNSFQDGEDDTCAKDSRPFTRNHARELQSLQSMFMKMKMDVCSWDDHLQLIEFAYNNSYHSSIKMAPYEALYRRKCRSPIRWFEVGETSLFGPDLVHQAMKKVSPTKGVMRFGKKGKLNPRHIWYKIIQRFGQVAYEFELPQELSTVHLAFHVSMLRKCIGDTSHITPTEDVQVTEDLTYEEVPIGITGTDASAKKPTQTFGYHSYIHEKYKVIGWCSRAFTVTGACPPQWDLRRDMQGRCTVSQRPRIERKLGWPTSRRKQDTQKFVTLQANHKAWAWASHLISQSPRISLDPSKDRTSPREGPQSIDTRHLGKENVSPLVGGSSIGKDEAIKVDLGLKINVRKCEITPAGVVNNIEEIAHVLNCKVKKCEITPAGVVNNIEEIAHMLNCKVSTLTISYMGLPLDASSKDLAVWNKVNERMEKLLAGWQKSTLSNRLESLQCNFLWGTSEGTRKHHHERMGRTRQDLKVFNKAMLEKWILRFRVEENAFLEGSIIKSENHKKALREAHRKRGEALNMSLALGLKRAFDNTVGGRCDRIRNEVTQDKVGVTYMVDKMRETRSRWFGHVMRRGSNALVRRCERLDIVSRNKGRGKPNSIGVRFATLEPRAFRKQPPYLPGVVVRSAYTLPSPDLLWDFNGSGGKSYDIAETKSSSERWFEWVESARLYMRMTLSRGVLSWICKRMYEASEFKGRSFKTWKVRDLSTSFFCSLKFNKFGRFLSVISVNGHSRAVIIIPENKPNEGWLSLANRIECFINREPSMHRNVPESATTMTLTQQSLRREDTYKEVLARSKWTLQEKTTPSDQRTTIPGIQSERNPTRRCLVGSFPECHEIPTRNDKQGKSLELDWWSPLSGTYPAEQKFAWSWIRVLGLPLHLWSANTMNKLGDKCGGWIETEEETSLKNHLRWARLKVKGTFNDIQKEIEISDGDLIFSLPVWVEAPIRFRRSEVVVLGKQKSSTLCKSGAVSFTELQKVAETNHILGLKRQGKYPLVNDLPAVEELYPSSFNNCIVDALISELEQKEKPESCMQLDNLLPNSCTTSSQKENSVLAPTRPVEVSNETTKMPGNQLISLENSTPIQFDSSECSKDVEIRTSSWVKINIIRLSKEFGALFDG